ncbi:hypothetical protein AB0I24_15050 [Brachybacterium paraconglomeratum]|uniref:hypothetical protein n=1 Tax=Brachybacterium TaxID=43668 RepID=UPI0021E09281|nr:MULTISPECIES: hypothetical protein [Brachybacterium]WME23023.1 hypothetical protein RBL05_16105 [Brachybacterium sp. GU-2]
MNATPAQPVHLVSAYGPTAGSTRVRLHDWARHLGLKTTVHEHLGLSSSRPSTLLRRPFALAGAELATRRAAEQVDGGTVVLSRSATPFSRGEVEERILRRASRAVYDVDDAIHLPVHGLMSRAFPKPLVFARAALAADVVLAGNEFLADAASQYAADVRIIPSCVEVEDYVHRSSRPAADVPRLVWIGSRFTERYLTSIAAAIDSACRRTGSSLLVISNGSGPVEGLDPALHERQDWDAGRFTEQLVLGDVGIMPLVDSDWERGKCSYKLLQYGAAELPVVGSPVGMNESVLRDLGGAAPTSLDEWEDALVAALGSSPEERAAAGARAMRAVQEGYSFAAHADAWVRAVGLPASEVIA